MLLSFQTGQLSPTTELTPTAAFRQGPATELKNFRVLGIIDKVLLVYDNVSEGTYVMKVSKLLNTSHFILCSLVYNDNVCIIYC